MVHRSSSITEPNLRYDPSPGYDVAARETSETNAYREITRLYYAPSGDLTILVDGNDHSTVWGYDQYGRVTNKLDQAGTVILKYAYDRAGRFPPYCARDDLVLLRSTRW